MIPEQICFVLVRPVFLGNIGATARVLKNFGFRCLRLVEPPRNYKDSEARRMSVGAFDLLKQAKVYPALTDALTDVNLAIGTTSGQQRDLNPQSLKDVAPRVLEAAGTNRVAVVFGDERNGLNRQELERCHHVVTIPTDAGFPALNVAQAVAIFAYELIRSAPDVKPEDLIYPSGAEDDELSAQIGSLLDKVSFSRRFNRETVISEFRQMYQRARPTARDLDLLKGLLHRINQNLKDSQ